MRYFWLIIGILFVIRVLIANYKWWFSSDEIEANETDGFLVFITLILLFIFVVCGIMYLTVYYW